MIRKAALAAVVLGFFLSVGSAVPSQARDRNDRKDKCEQQVRKAQENLNKAIQKHGERSRQAEQQRRKLEDARAKCEENQQRRDSHRDHDKH